VTEPMEKPGKQPGQAGGPAGQAAAPTIRRSYRKLAMTLGVLTGLLLAATAWACYYYFPSRIGPAQPISFSHRVHVAEKQISCFMCHTGAIDTPRAGVPPLETCMLCHSRIIIGHPEIVKLREHFDRRKPVEWVRVNQLPDFVYFNHEIHVRAGFDCGHCHGNVAQMDRVALVQDFQMGFCVQCHRDNNFSHDCLICHR